VTTTLAYFRARWNAALDALSEADGPAQQWGNLTDDNLLHLTCERGLLYKCWHRFSQSLSVQRWL
jgi:hypothetical protein